MPNLLDIIDKRASLIRYGRKNIEAINQFYKTGTVAFPKTVWAHESGNSQLSGKNEAFELIKLYESAYKSEIENLENIIQSLQDKVNKKNLPKGIWLSLMLYLSELITYKLAIDNFENEAEISKLDLTVLLERYCRFLIDEKKFQESDLKFTFDQFTCLDKPKNEDEIPAFSLKMIFQIDDYFYNTMENRVFPIEDKIQMIINLFVFFKDNLPYQNIIKAFCSIFHDCCNEMDSLTHAMDHIRIKRKLETDGSEDFTTKQAKTDLFARVIYKRRIVEDDPTQVNLAKVG